MTETEQIGQDQNYEICTRCQDDGMIRCPAHMAETDAEGWCTYCDSPDEPEMVNCPCLDGQ